MSEGSEIMERSNLFGDPVHSIIAIFKEGTPRDEAVKAIRSEGFGEDEVTVMDDYTELEALDEDDGLLDGVRKVIAYDETDIERNYKEAVRLGHTVVLVHLDTEDEEKRIEQRNNVSDIFFSHDAQYVHYYGENAFEEVMVNSEDGEESYEG